MNGLALLIEYGRPSGEGVGSWLQDAGHDVVALGSGGDCLRALSTMLPDTVVLDRTLPDLCGLEVLEAIGRAQPLVPVILMTSDTSTETVECALQRGAYDYLSKPIDRTELLTTVGNAVACHRMSVRLEQLESGAGGVVGVVGSSPSAKVFRARIARAAMEDVPVLLHGESGSGKELGARAIHEASGRAAAPLVTVDCAAIPGNEQESELFGRSGRPRRGGRLALADRGTLLLKEVGALGPGAQTRLLDALEEHAAGRADRSGGIGSGIRLLATTTRDLRAEVAGGRFRDDLLRRIAALEIDLAPLRTRREDIPALTLSFLRDLGLADGDRGGHVAPDALDALLTYDWPGNVRELQAVVQRAALGSATDTITRADLPRGLLEATRARASASAAGQVGDPLGGDYGSLPLLRLDELERLAIENALRHTKGNVSAVVRHLGIGRTTLYRKLKKYGLQQPGSSAR